jgi:hypothetical protein
MSQLTPEPDLTGGENQKTKYVSIKLSLFIKVFVWIDKLTIILDLKNVARHYINFVLKLQIHKCRHYQSF